MRRSLSSDHRLLAFAHSTVDLASRACPSLPHPTLPEDERAVMLKKAGPSLLRRLRYRLRRLYHSWAVQARRHLHITVLYHMILYVIM